MQSGNRCFSYQKGSEEWLQRVMFVFWVTVPTDFLVRHDSPWPVSWTPVGSLAQSPAMAAEVDSKPWRQRKAWGSQSQLGLEPLALPALHPTTPKTGLRATLRKAREGKGILFSDWVHFSLLGKGSTLEHLWDGKGLGNTSSPLPLSVHDPLP